MCLIIDANLIHSVFPTPTADFEPIYSAVFKGAGRLVYGGHLGDEYQQSRKLWRFVLTLDRAGRAHQAPRDAVDHETQSLIQAGACCSDDPHVVALARVTGARLLCSLDGNLGTDFRNPQLISGPRGHVYKDTSHRHLIRQHCPDPRPHHKGQR